MTSRDRETINRNTALIRRYNKDRDAAVRSLDVEAFKNFCKRWGNPVPPTDYITEITMRKMMYHLNCFSDEEKQGTKEWLESRGCTTDIG